MTEALIQHAHNNLMKSWAQLVSMSQKGEAFEQNGLVITNSHKCIPAFNRIFIKPAKAPFNANSVCIDQLRRAAAYFKQNRLPFELCLQHNLEGKWIGSNCNQAKLIQFIQEASLTKQANQIGMIHSATANTPLSMNQTAEPPKHIQLVTRINTLTDFHSIAANAYNIPIRIITQMLPPEILRHPNIKLFVAYHQTKPTAISMAINTGSTKGIYWVGTHTDHQRQGFAKAVTVKAMATAFGNHDTVTSLQAINSLTASLYKQLGFMETTQIQFWRWTPPNPVKSKG